MKIRPSDLSDEALAGVIDSFVLKEGTDYGHRDYSIQEKRDSVRKLLCSGKAEIVYDKETDYIDIVSTT